MKKKVLTTKSNTGHRKATKSPYIDELRIQHQFWSEKEMPKIILDRLAERIYGYIDENKENKYFTTLKKMFNDIKVNQGSLSGWMKKSDKLKTAHAFCLQVLADRRETRSLENNLHYHTMRMKQYQYDPKWKEAEEYHASLKAKIAAAGNTKKAFQEGIAHVLKDVDYSNIKNPGVTDTSVVDTSVEKPHEKEKDDGTT